ncbi:MAG: hypothetical protein ACFFFC_03940 [Candidatus Thorarchaeota archaeon]
MRQELEVQSPSFSCAPPSFWVPTREATIVHPPISSVTIMGKPQAVIYALVLDCITVMRIPMERTPQPVEGIFYCMNESPAGHLIGCSEQG